MKDERPVDERIIGFKKKIENRNKSGKDTDADENDKSSKDTNFKNEKVVNKELKRKSSRKTSKLYKLNNSLKTDELMKLKKDLEISVNNNNNNGKSKKPFFNDKISGGNLLTKHLHHNLIVYGFLAFLHFFSKLIFTV